MKYYIIAGEQSGDLHGSNLMKAIQLKDANADFRFFGGDKMQAVGGELVKHYKEMAFMGFAEVVKNLPSILKNLKRAKEDLIKFKPNVLILIDYPGFNLKIARFAKEKGIKVHYYISPKVWAWKEGRVESIKKYVDKMITILPFETEFYDKHSYQVDYVGNPLMDEIVDYKKNAEILKSDKPVLALLPGSRKQELLNMLPIMAKAAKSFEDKFSIYVACTPNFDLSFYKELVGDLNAEYLVDQTYDILNSAKLAMVTSGTATLEAGIFNVPQVVCYKGNKITIWIARKLVKLKYISLVNLIMDKMVVEELIQEEFTVEKVSNALKRFQSEEGAAEIAKNYSILNNKLGGSGASGRAAEVIVNDIS
jgi:lipid-A-disaccharide synthase